MSDPLIEARTAFEQRALRYYAGNPDGLLLSYNEHSELFRLGGHLWLEGFRPDDWPPLKPDWWPDYAWWPGSGA